MHCFFKKNVGFMKRETKQSVQTLSYQIEGLTSKGSNFKHIL
jgi:hypothetical protein